MLSVWFIGSVLLLAIGVVGEYIGKIYVEVKNRPSYTVDEILWDEPDPDAEVDSKRRKS
ncbi:hypothetical protein JCM6294_300 [Bacteroides pyogenes DSM 20611 = JCM 6294]|nr:hypothetical protein JCM6294_300 [Bacteroides pyogenes DSM 20611 = JCM 6294]